MDPEDVVRVGVCLFVVVVVFESSTYFTDGRMDLPRKAIASRERSVPAFL